jgi:tRNA (guanine37-N1)-methyltransferase
MVNFKIFTLFPELFPGPLSASITGQALAKKLWNIEAINIRNYAFDTHKTVDDVPYGGGAGMLMKPDVLAHALEKNCQKNKKIYYFSPRGKVFDQEMAINLAKEDEINLVCARYEGIDQRVIDEFEIEEISIGDFILSGGEIAAFTLIDAVLRNIDGVLGKEVSLKEESFCMEESKFLLEYPHYTRPASWRGLEVPEVLTSGHHKKIKEWQLEQAIKVTKEKRPDLYQKFLQNNK